MKKKNKKTEAQTSDLVSIQSGIISQANGQFGWTKANIFSYKYAVIEIQAMKNEEKTKNHIASRKKRPRLSEFKVSSLIVRISIICDL